MRSGALREAKTALVFGRVQGVGFRWAAQAQAQRLKLTGWVRNNEDGSVSCYFEGLSPSVQAFTDWLRHGPPGAEVDTVKLNDAVVLGTYTRFTIEY